MPVASRIAHVLSSAVEMPVLCAMSTSSGPEPSSTVSSRSCVGVTSLFTMVAPVMRARFASSVPPFAVRAAAVESACGGGTSERARMTPPPSLITG